MDEVGLRKWGNQLERVSWLMVLLGMLTQVSTVYAFPSYNLILGFWGAYCAFSRKGRACFGLLMFTFLGIILDIVFCGVNSFESTTFQFALVVLVMCMITKVYVLFCGSHFFAALGGAHAIQGGGAAVQQDGDYSNMPTPSR